MVNIQASAAFVNSSIAPDDETVHMFQDLWWIQALWFTDKYGLRWRVVTQQQITCPGGFGLDRTSMLGQCQPCPVGQFSEQSSLECTACETGYVAGRAALTSCTQCPPATYQDANQAVCFPCISPSTSRAGAWQCNECIEGYYRDKITSDCLACPSTGALCAGGRNLVSEEGYWRTNENSLNFLRCPFGSACIGSNGTTHQCLEGYHGPKCAVCQRETHFLSNMRCLSCRGNESGSLLLRTAIGAVLLMLILILHKLGYANRLRSQFLKRMPKWFYLGFIDVAKFKIMWANLQITAAMSWALQIDWPEPFASYVQLLSFMVCLKNPISGLSMCPPQP